MFLLEEECRASHFRALLIQRYISFIGLISHFHLEICPLIFFIAQAVIQGGLIEIAVLQSNILKNYMVEKTPGTWHREYSPYCA